MPIPLDALMFVALVIFAGYLTFGVTGFGASPITIPVLVHVFPLTFVLPLAALLDLASALALGFHTRRQADTYVMYLAGRIPEPAGQRAPITPTLSLAEGEGVGSIPSPPEGERDRVRGRIGRGARVRE